MTDYRETLRRIRTFPSLIKFLQEELDWPIISGDFEELYFEYTPEELGIDTANAAKIQEIKRLRPLSVNQPWGIFFVMFEPKRLPVVALRRILSRVVLKKRASANRAESTAWQADDLLFVSNYGEGEERQISFAHFAQHGQKNDLPTLKVLGWDNLDTALHLDHVADMFSNRLAWPADVNNLENWRETWRSAFTLRHQEVINTSKDLAVRLAELARAIRDRIKTVLAIETVNGPLTKLMKAFQEALVHDLDEGGFADMYAQTITYGLLAARVENPSANTADDLAAQMPVTNPFLKELMETFLHVGGRKGKAGGPGLDFDELGVSEVVELLDAANMEAVVRDFGDRKPEEDPVIHFYELFLKEYDARKKIQRGVFYTPRPVVSFIVRSVDELLRTEFGLTDGLADTTTWSEMAERHAGLTIPEGAKPDEPFVQILDPATGTGTFLVEVIDLIHKTMTKKWQAQGHGVKEIHRLWNDYVPWHLLPRLYGYELLMAPYAIAHMKIGLKLYETGYRFGSDERVRVYLTNALEPAHDFSGRFAVMISALAHEAQAVNDIKRHQRFTIVIGNPPYSNFGQLNRIPFILHLLDDYKRGLDEKKLNLDDDYIKFIRFGQFLLDISGFGVFGMITNNVFMDGITHRRMRESLRASFSLIAVCDLHGSVKKLEKAPNGSKDENVFDIQQGVGITFLVRRPQYLESSVHYGEVWGGRTDKYSVLTSLSITDKFSNEVLCEPPYYFFVPKTFTEAEVWNEWLRLPEIMPTYSTGIKTHLDDVFVGFSPSEIDAAIATFLSAMWRNVPISSAKRASSLRKALLLKEALRVNKSSAVTDYAYRAFDTRKVAYLPPAIEAGDHRYPVMRHLLSSNIALATTRQLSQGGFSHALVTRSISDMCLLSTATKECAYIFPLEILPKKDLLNSAENSWNLCSTASAFLDRLGGQPIDFLCYAYAVFHSPGYRSRYSEFLKIDFPRLPLTSNLELFQTLARLGGELVALHLVEAPVQQALSARYDQVARAWRYDVAPGQRLPVALTFTGPAAPVVEKVGWLDDTVWLDAAATKKGQPTTPGSIGFRGVPEEVWNFHIGGYQVCQKWLKDRKGRTLSADDLTHYHRIVIALHETIRLMAEIDKVIDQHGGWPDAFTDGAPHHS